MKSFRLISMQIVGKDHVQEIELEEGLIINKEDEHGNWLLEAFVDEKFVPHFEEASAQNQDIIVQVVITKKENDPAAFSTKVTSIQKINGKASILLKGHLSKIRNDYPALLLEHLLEQGLHGEELLAEFKDKVLARPKIVLPKKA
ncbi:YwpF family protein [Mesobacillus foraminis]|uniref:YwpF-like protein n=1 Tax=Mesobacillus foraminis TaxID=279826 RepID=A0A4R2BB13_9BACI|nr:YwpF family protein [Mesobacillus foraminis]TCN24127.1 YwpF-like protein [Mesobacillus foraminis]